MDKDSHFRQFIDKLANTNIELFIFRLELFDSNWEESLIGPSVKPVYGTTVDNWRELSASIS